ncbi:DNA cytosine methyltransferase [Fodinibius sp.]|uniref:DNA cytosine methyltransferase n=1 Tax=Fodinibius sp. TaxID=1872440 RepID=UPI002ACEA6D0|nr:DNA cytosine methyltransferase [Fodinibius sp.]MDZ7658709.1 DNA cytosine methyltransferase [Fodinibius sp.]
MGINSRDKKNKFKAVDFFCGAGGVTCGFEEVGIDVILGIDKDGSCKKTYEENNEAGFLEADISKLDKKCLSEDYGIERNDDNLIFIGCSPCQYYTNLKTDKTKSKESKLLLEDFQEFLEYYKPGFIFIENVPGIEKKEESPLKYFKRFLSDENYVYDEDVINAKYLGVPQNRRRYILVATRVRNEICLPAENKDEIRTLKEAIGDYKTFPKVEAGHTDDSDFQHSVANLSSLNLRRVKRTPKDGGSRLSWADDEELQLDCYKKHDGHYDVYGRMYWDKPSPTITTKFRYTSTGRYTHPEQNRGISLREGATLQSFPLSYVFHSKSQNEIAKMIGNAVPPKLAKKVACIF